MTMEAIETIIMENALKGAAYYLWREFEQLARERDAAVKELATLKESRANEPRPTIEPLVEAIKAAGHFTLWDSEAQCTYPFSQSLAYRNAITHAEKLGEMDIFRR